MKRLTVILVFMCTYGYGQDKLEGKYSTGPYDNYSLTFKKNGKLHYSLLGCTSFQEANGKYKIENNKLTLNFDGIKKYESHYSIKDYEDCNTNSANVKIIFKVKDKAANEPMPYATIALYSENIQIGEIRTDTNGIAQFTLAKSIKELEIKVLYVGYNKLVFKVKPEERCKSIEVHLDGRSNIDLYHDGKPFDYKIVKTDTSTKLILFDALYKGNNMIFKKEKD